jgi:hypothetical protein
MRNLLALLGAALVVFAIVGWYRGWYQFETAAGADGQRDVKIEINGPKIGKDLKHGTQQLENVLEKGKNQPPAIPPAAAQAVQLPGGLRYPADAPRPTQLPPPTGPVFGAPTAPPPNYAPPGYPQGETYVLPPTSPAVPAPQAPRPYPNFDYNKSGD